LRARWDVFPRTFPDGAGRDWGIPVGTLRLEGLGVIADNRMLDSGALRSAALRWPLANGRALARDSAVRSEKRNGDVEQNVSEDESALGW
jgi:hypothetical protein